jgi:hypothetical protein
VAGVHDHGGVAMLAFAWSTWYAVVLGVAVGITTVGGALVLIFGGAQKIKTLVRPSKPLVSFGHPHETSGLPFYFLSDDPSFNARQDAEHESYRLSHLDVKYLIENKDDLALRELTTGARTRDGDREHTFPDHYVQILSAGDATEVENAKIPSDWYEGMTDSNRAENFIFWARFERAGKRWEASYDPKTRELGYRRLRRQGGAYPALRVA